MSDGYDFHNQRTSIQSTISAPPQRFRRRRTPSPAPPKFKNFEDRLKSFNNSGWSPDTQAQPLNLAKAGFYFIGPKDRVKCGFCGGKLKTWRMDDSPVNEHVRHFPDCSFVKTIEEQTSILFKNVRDESKIDACIDSEELMKRTTEYRRQITQSAPYEMIMTTLQKMGFKKTLIEKASIKCNSEMLLPNIKNMLKIIQVFEKALFFDDLETCNELTAQASKKNEYVQELENDKSELIKERDELTNQLNCKVCLSNKADTLFLTCRHFVTCNICASQIKDCPICRHIIIGTVDVFMC